MSDSRRGQEGATGAVTPISLLLDLARDSAAAAHGPRIVIKDNMAVAGYPTVMGSARFADAAPATRHAEVVDRLIAAGGHIIGRVGMHELAYGVTGRNDWAGTPTNPHWPDRIVGGSSSGCAAAVAAGLVEWAIGTDTGGSIRMPAACCGVAGLKPTFGLVSRAGVEPAVSSLDCVGPMARDVAGIDAAMAVIAPGYARAEAANAPRVALIRCDADADVAEAFDRVAGELACDRRTAELPGMAAAFEAGITIIGAEMWRAFAWLAPDFQDIGADVAQRLRRAATITPEQVAAAEAVRTAFTAEVDQLLADNDFLLLPTLPAAPPLLPDAEDAQAQLRMTQLIRPFNLSGHPALTVPTRTAGGLPAGIQIVGRKGDDAAVCGMGRIIETYIAPLVETQS